MYRYCGWGVSWSASWSLDRSAMEMPLLGGQKVCGAPHISFWNISCDCHINGKYRSLSVTVNKMLTNKSWVLRTSGSDLHSSPSLV